MAIKNQVQKTGRDRRDLPARRATQDSFLDFRRDMNRLFDDFFGELSLAPRWGAAAPMAFSPRVDVAETDREVKITAELPGLDKKDIVVEMDNATLALRGEKKEEKEEKGKNWRRREQSYGSFQRIVPLPAAVDGAKAKAKFAKGVLTVTAPKQTGAQSQAKTVAIESA